MVSMNWEFKVGDEVITVDGRRGTIKYLCDCNFCKSRGFLEPVWEDETGDEDHISCYEAKSNFEIYHKIGKYYFHPFRRDEVEQGITYYEKLVNQMRNRLEYIDRLLATEGEVTYET